MDRTTRAAVLAAVIAFAAVAGLGSFLVPGAEIAAIVTGLVAALLAGLLLLAASRRADSFEERPPIRPRHPGPPEPSDDSDDDSDVTGAQPDDDEDDRV